MNHFVSIPGTRKTKIITTLGPATDSLAMLQQLVERGVDIFRLNMSHAPHDWVRRVVGDIRYAASKCQRHVEIIMDTQGPAIRTGELPVPLALRPGEKFTLTVRGERSEEERSVDVNYENFVNDISIGDVVLLDNGTIEMKVLAKNGNKVQCEVLTEGSLGSRRHINLPGVKVSLPALTAKDILDVKLGLELQLDFIALSFVRQARDLAQLRELFPATGPRPQPCESSRRTTPFTNLAPHPVGFGTHSRLETSASPFNAGWHANSMAIRRKCAMLPSLRSQSFCALAQAVSTRSSNPCSRILRPWCLSFPTSISGRRPKSKTSAR